MLLISECNPILNNRIMAPSWANILTTPSVGTKCGISEGKTGIREFRKPARKGQTIETEEGEMATPNNSKTITTGCFKRTTNNSAKTAANSRKVISNQILFSSGTSPNKLARITEK
jgi:hypothetical protein